MNVLVKGDLSCTQTPTRRKPFLVETKSRGYVIIMVQRCSKVILVVIFVGCLLWFFLGSVTIHESRRARNKAVVSLNEDSFVPLTEDQISGVQKFVYFVGFARSGHSIIGSMMDAHPNMVISNQYQLTAAKTDPALRAGDRTKTRLFNHLYENSFQESRAGLRTADSERKGYTLEVPGAWQGRFQTLNVIGNKLGGLTTFLYVSDPKGVQKFFQDLRETVQVPLSEIYVVRNPFDIISTVVLYAGHKIQYGGKGTRMEASKDNKYHNIILLEERITAFFRLAHALKEMIKSCSLDNLLLLHIEDFIQDPVPLIRKICDHLDLECPSDYVQQCYNKTFREVSRSRDTVYWPLELRKSAVQQMSEFPEFAGYTFEDDYRRLR